MSNNALAAFLWLLNISSTATSIGISSALLGIHCMVFSGAASSYFWSCGCELDWLFWGQLWSRCPIPLQLKQHPSLYCLSQFTAFYYVTACLLGCGSNGSSPVGCLLPTVAVIFDFWEDTWFQDWFAWVIISICDLASPRVVIEVPCWAKEYTTLGGVLAIIQFTQKGSSILPMIIESSYTFSMILIANSFHPE